MRVLVVEDVDRVVEVLKDAFTAHGIELIVAQSRDTALERIADSEFDLAICDLKLPATDTSLDLELDHGLDVCDTLRASRPGVPVLVFSAFGTMEVLGSRLEEAPSHDLFGTERVPMIRQVDKGKMTAFTEKVVEHANQLEKLAAEIELSWTGDRVDLTHDEERVLQIYARRRKGVLVHLRAMKEGLSGAKTLRVEVEAAGGQMMAILLAKIDNLVDLEDEHDRFDTWVSPLLPPGSFASHADSVLAGAGTKGGLFYSLVPEDHRSLFALLADDESAGADVVRVLRSRVDRWQGQPGNERATVGELRARQIKDTTLDTVEHLLPDELRERVEANAVNLHTCPGHGDLHGENLLVNVEGHPVLIDFAKVGLGAGCIDPITLEVSPVLHPHSDLALGTWPTEDQARAWIDLESYVAGCPIETYVRECRDWADAIARGTGELLATVYAYAVRQLQYPDVNVDLAGAYAEGALTELDR